MQTLFGYLLFLIKLSEWQFFFDLLFLLIASKYLIMKGKYFMKIGLGSFYNPEKISKERMERDAIHPGRHVEGALLNPEYDLERIHVHRTAQGADSEMDIEELLGRSQVVSRPKNDENQKIKDMQHYLKSLKQDKVGVSSCCSPKEKFHVLESELMNAEDIKSCTLVTDSVFGSEDYAIMIFDGKNIREYTSDWEITSNKPCSDVNEFKKYILRQAKDAADIHYAAIGTEM